MLLNFRDELNPRDKAGASFAGFDLKHGRVLILYCTDSTAVAFIMNHLFRPAQFFE
jgi:hypothetical protein